VRLRAEPNTLRYGVLDAAARPSAADATEPPKIAATWPWAEAITTAWQHIQAIPHPT
jgi:hypothetical protein